MTVIVLLSIADFWVEQNTYSSLCPVELAS